MAMDTKSLFEQEMTGGHLQRESSDTGNPVDALDYSDAAGIEHDVDVDVDGNVDVPVE